MASREHVQCSLSNRPIASFGLLYEKKIGNYSPELVMKIRLVLIGLIMVIGSYANASTVAVGNQISWTARMTGVGSNIGRITLNADTSGAAFNGLDVGYLSGIELKRIGATPDSRFTITSVSLSDWNLPDDRHYGVSRNCEDASNGSSGKHGCAFTENPSARISSAAGDLAIVLGVELDSAVLLDKFYLKGRWDDANGKRAGGRISEDLTAVPLPAAAWLFTSALMGLLLVARQKNGEAALAT